MLQYFNTWFDGEKTNARVYLYVYGLCKRVDL